MTKNNFNSNTRPRLVLLVALRVAIGWHFMYEGVAKILQGNWTAQPPIMSAEYMFPGEGSYLWVNKNLIELLALAVLYVFPTGHIIGIDRLFKKER